MKQIKDPEVTTELMPAQSPELPPPAIINAEDPVGLFKLAIETKAGADTLERVMAVRRELRAEKAKEAFDTAMAEFQSECPSIGKDRAAVGRDGKPMYHYAPLDSIVQQTQELRRKHGFSHSMTTEVDPGWVKAVCTVKHCMGHSEVSVFKVPATSRSPMMNDPQMYAAALTFAKRYAFCNAFGIMTGDEDTDGRTQKPKPQGPSSVAADDADAKPMAQELWTLLRDVRGPEKNWKKANEYLFELGIINDTEELPHVPAKRLREIIDEFKAHQ